MACRCPVIAERCSRLTSRCHGRLWRPRSRPRRGPAPRRNKLLAAMGLDAPSDPHQEKHVRHPPDGGPLYSTIDPVDPLSYPKIIGDAASEWKDRARRSDVHVQDPSRESSSHDGSSLKLVESATTISSSSARGVRMRSENATGNHEHRDPGPETRRVQAKYAVGLVTGQLGLPWNGHLPESTWTATQLFKTKGGRARGSDRFNSRATRAARPSRASAIRTTSQGPAVPERLTILSTQPETSRSRASAVRSGWGGGEGGGGGGGGGRV